MSASRASASSEALPVPPSRPLPARAAARHRRRARAAIGASALGADDRGTDTGEVAFGKRRTRREEVLSDDEPEHRIAKKLEAFVRADTGVLGDIGTVHEGVPEGFVGESPTNTTGESEPRGALFVPRAVRRRRRLDARRASGASQAASSLAVT